MAAVSTEIKDAVAPSPKHEPGDIAENERAATIRDISMDSHGKIDSVSLRTDENAQLRKYAICAGCDGEISFPEHSMFGKTVRAGKSSNEDAAYVFPGDRDKCISKTIAVADGVGGWEDGEIA